MKVIICGSRDWSDEEAIRERVAQLPEHAVVITGGAKGADTIAFDAAQARGLQTAVFRADWEQHGRSAGYLRNLEMLDQRPVLVIAYQLGDSPGTEHTIKAARKRSIPVELVKDENTISLFDA